MRLNPAIRASSWCLMLALSLFLAGMTLRYYSFRPDIHFLHVKQWIIDNSVWRTAFYLHITGGVLAIVIGPFQLLRKSRTKFKSLHRTFGKIYLIAILCIAAPSGFYMSLFAEGGPWASAGFSVMAMLWFYTTWVAYSTVRAKKFTEHSRWMRRSYALTFSAVTLRIWVPVSSIVFALKPHDVIVLSAWVSWAMNLLVVEIFIQMSRRSKKKHQTIIKSDEAPHVRLNQSLIPQYSAIEII